MIVCVCNRITEKEVCRAARDGARTGEKAYERLGCDVQCGCCLDYAQEVIDQELSSRPFFRVVASHAA
jgi:bacterioferritin-associated ferredoxin